MSGFIEGASRDQAMLLPECLDDYVDESNPVRIVDAFVELLDLAALGFKTIPEATGRPGYHPGMMLRLYIYGYLNRIQSSRRLERECGRNLELVWLTGRLQPDFKTIADFRKDNGPAIRKVCQQFVLFCREMSLLDAKLVAIDGSRFKASNAKAKNFTREKLTRKLGEIDAAIARYMAELDRADAAEAESGEPLPRARLERLMRKLTHLVGQAERFRAVEERMKESGETQISLSDPDARSMATTARMPRVVGYNVQSVVDAEHHLIVAHEVTMHGHDRDALSTMAVAARDVMTADEIEAVADKGYYKSEEILASEEAGISVTIPRSPTSNAGARGRFDKADFAYLAAGDVYRCPAGERLTYRFATKDDGKVMRVYWFGGCGGCALKDKCTTGKERRIRRWEHEDVLDRVQQRLEADPSKLALRSMTVEHPFGTIKSWMGATHFQMRRLKNVRTEMALHVLAYNMKRVIQILGIPTLLTAMAT
jgi:transposase